MNCDRSVQPDNAPALFKRLEWAKCKVCEAEWVGARQIPCGSSQHNQQRNITDIFISWTSVRSEQLLLLVFGGISSVFCCYPQMRVCPRALPMIHHLLMLNPLAFVKSLIRAGSETPSLQKWLRSNPKGITGRNVWKLQFNLSFRSW